MRTISRGAAWSRSALPVAAKALVVLAIVEFVLLRVVNRMSGAFPAWMRGEVSSDLVLAGSFAYNGAYLLSLVLIVLVAILVWARDAPFATLLLMWAPAVLLAQAFASGSVAVVALAGLVGAAVLVATVVRALRDSPAAFPGPGPARRVPFLGSRLAFRAFLVLVLGTFLAGLYLHVGDAFANLGGSPPARTEVYAAGEILGVLAAVVASLAFWRPPNRWNLGLAASGVLIVAAPAIARPELLPLIGYWSVGFRVDLFFPLYLIAAGAFLFAVANVWRSGPRSRYLLYGLVLILLAGRQLPDFYAVQLAVSGLLFLGITHELPTGAPARPSRGDPAGAASDFSGDDARVTRTSSR